MCRSWGKYVMRKLIPTIKERVLSILSDYQQNLIDVAADFDEYKKGKFNYKDDLARDYSLTKTQYDVLRQMILSIVDLSIEEHTVKYVENSKLYLEHHYPEIETSILEQSKLFLKEVLSVADFKTSKEISDMYYENMRGV